MSGLTSLGNVGDLDKLTNKMGVAGTAPTSQAEMAAKRKKCELLTGEARTECIARTPTYAGKRCKTRGRRKTRRSRRRKTRGGVETNPKGSPNGYGASGTAALAARLRSAKQQEMASTSRITGLPRVPEGDENGPSTTTMRKEDGPRGPVSGLFEKKGARRTRRR